MAAYGSTADYWPASVVFIKLAQKNWMVFSGLWWQDWQRPLARQTWLLVVHILPQQILGTHWHTHFGLKRQTNAVSSRVPSCSHDSGDVVLVVYGVAGGLMVLRSCQLCRAFLHVQLFLVDIVQRECVVEEVLDGWTNCPVLHGRCLCLSVFLLLFSEHPNWQ